MMRRAVWILAIALTATGCSSGLLPTRGPEPDELAEIKSRVLELQRTAAMTQVEIDRLRQQVVALETRLGISPPPPAAAASSSPPPTRPPASAPARGEPARVEEPAVRQPEVEVTDLEVPPPAARPTPPPPAVAVPSPPPAASSPASSGPTAPVGEAGQALYDRGYTLYHQGRYVDAEAGFRRFLQAYPDTSLSDNAQYWIGESRFARADFDGALAAFREVVQRYPGGNKVADSLLKAADCLQRLGDPEAARSTYDEVIRRFPGSAAGAMAEERRGQLPR